MDPNKLKHIAIAVTQTFQREQATPLEAMTVLVMIAEGLHQWSENPAAFEAKYGNDVQTRAGAN